MSWFDELPEVITRADFGSLVGRPPRNIELMASRGLAADPLARNRNKFVWSEEAALDWFRSLQEHAVIVPASKQVMDDLAAYNAYVCPLDSKHVGLARPKMLVMYRPGGTGLVFGVDAVETVNQEIDGTRPASAQTRRITRNGEALDSNPFPRPWTVFRLKEAGTIGKVTPAVHQGRYLRIDDVLDALTTDHLALPTLDEAFPARK
ncbi:hypothetical protein [Streptomyces sp. ITFR-6]|uniref:hypothetical protein n=1 Tax=Streptomyces sp. ITFR-6 TaxID=3075197 RepID=UPI00288C2623|nr:hypothetical protein [Streptomyces sp. ITFR-6]WNI30085.1 hypothetical protein RLT59_15740 [Streptomyces sp. ITFR-6]